LTHSFSSNCHSPDGSGNPFFALSDHRLSEKKCGKKRLQRTAGIAPEKNPIQMPIFAAHEAKMAELTK